MGALSDSRTVRSAGRGGGRWVRAVHGGVRSGKYFRAVDGLVLLPGGVWGCVGSTSEAEMAGLAMLLFTRRVTRKVHPKVSSDSDESLSSHVLREIHWADGEVRNCPGRCHLDSRSTTWTVGHLDSPAISFGQL